MAGPAAAAALAAGVGAEGLLWINCAGFSAGLLATLPLLARTSSPVERPATRPRPLLVEAAERVGVALRYPWLRWLFATDLLHLIVPVAAWLLLVQVLAEGRWGPGSQGYVLAAFGLGGMVGGWVAGRARPHRTGPAVVVSQWLFVVPLAVLAFDVPLAAMMLAAFVGGVGNELNTVWLDTVLARKVPGELIGRVLSSVFVVSMIFLPLGYLIAAWLLRYVEPSTLLGWSAVGLTAASAMSLAAPSVRALRAATLRPSMAAATPEVGRG